MELETDKYLITVEEQTKEGVAKEGVDSSPPAAKNCASLINAQPSTCHPQKPVRHGLPRPHHGTRSAPYMVTPRAQQTPPVSAQPSQSIRSSVQEQGSPLSRLNTQNDRVGFSVYGQGVQREGHLASPASNLGLKQLIDHHTRGCVCVCVCVCGVHVSQTIVYSVHVSQTIVYSVHVILCTNLTLEGIKIGYYSI